MGRTSDAKERLLEVASDLIWRNSYGAVSVDQICQQAGVKKGSFYYFFPSKSDLAVEAFERHWTQAREKYDRIFSAQTPPVERILNYCGQLYETQKRLKAETGQVLGCPYASVGSELSTQDEKIRHKAAELFERGCKYLESALRDARRDGIIDNEDFQGVAHSVYSLVTGTLFQAKVRNDAEVLKQLGPDILQLIGAKTLPNQRVAVE